MVFTVVLAKLLIIKLIIYNMVVFCYDKILVNMAAYVIPG